MHCLEGRERRGLLCTGCGSCAVESYLIESFIYRGLSKGRGRNYQAQSLHCQPPRGRKRTLKGVHSTIQH